MLKPDRSHLLDTKRCTKAHTQWKRQSESIKATKDRNCSIQPGWRGFVSMSKLERLIIEKQLKLDFLFSTERTLFRNFWLQGRNNFQEKSPQNTLIRHQEGSHLASNLRLFRSKRLVYPIKVSTKACVLRNQQLSIRTRSLTFIKEHGPVLPVANQESRLRHPRTTCSRRRSTSISTKTEAPTK